MNMVGIGNASFSNRFLQHRAHFQAPKSRFLASTISAEFIMFSQQVLRRIPLQSRSSSGYANIKTLNLEGMRYILLAVVHQYLMWFPSYDITAGKLHKLPAILRYRSGAWPS